MTDALTRAARGIFVFEGHTAPDIDIPPSTYEAARVTILAFLDGEDVVEVCAAALAREDGNDAYHDTAHADEKYSPVWREYAAEARAAIAALRALVQEEK